MIHTKSISNQLIRGIFSLLSIYFTSCEGPKKPENLNIGSEQPSELPKKSTANALNSNSATEIDNNIRSIFQAENGCYWFGTNGVGVYRYDGKTLLQYTIKDGLPNNQVQSIQEDTSGNIWFGTGVFGVCRFDGKAFTTFTNTENLLLNNGFDNWKTAPNDLWFYAGGGAYCYKDKSFVYLPLDKKQSQNDPYKLSRFAVYSILKDKKGNMWFGTQSQGVCRFDGKSFTWFTEKGLAGPAVLGLFEDRNGNIWFGNNGAGLFRYDGKSLLNFTEEKGLSNPEFKISRKPGPGTLARIYTINEDNAGDLWIGTVDAGVWRYNGSTLTNYIAKADWF